MKKLVFMALAAIALATVSCNRTPKADLKDEADTLVYALGVAQSQGLNEYLTSQGMDSTVVDDFLKGFAEGLNINTDDKKAMARMMGIQIGANFSQNINIQLKQQVFPVDTLRTLSLSNFMAGFFATVKGQKTLIAPEQAQEVFQRLVTSIPAKQYESNKKAGEEFLANYVKGGAKKLPCGVAYKVLKEGKGECPTDTSKVKVHYEGKTIDGKVFDSSYKRDQPQEMLANQVIKGWTEVLKAMPVGSKWEVVIPAELAYGERAAGADIQPYSTLVFTIELISIEK